VLDNLSWQALHSEHARFAISTPSACRYPVDVAPFAGTADNSEESLRQLATLLNPNETFYLMEEAPAIVPELVYGEVFCALQMLGTATIPVMETREHELAIVPLTCQDAPAMVALTDLAFPGFFRTRTCEMGNYFGIRDGDRLIAMGGERLAVPGWREVSGVCTHPDYTGRGFAARLIVQLLCEHAKAGLRSFLHVGCANTRAIDLYYRLGFSLRKQFHLYPVSRSPG
jgi:ribosomal protein S18 acetylase RimI-like enzyme